jgi:hypothetical protein
MRKVKWSEVMSWLVMRMRRSELILPSSHWPLVFDM